jgi:hypothetical protein
MHAGGRQQGWAAAAAADQEPARQTRSQHGRPGASTADQEPARQTRSDERRRGRRGARGRGAAARAAAVLACTEPGSQFSWFTQPTARGAVGLRHAMMADGCGREVYTRLSATCAPGRLQRRVCNRETTHARLPAGADMACRSKTQQFIHGIMGGPLLLHQKQDNRRSPTATQQRARGAGGGVQGGFIGGRGVARRCWVRLWLVGARGLSALAPAGGRPPAAGGAACQLGCSWVGCAAYRSADFVQCAGASVGWWYRLGLLRGAGRWHHRHHLRHRAADRAGAV